MPLHSVLMAFQLPEKGVKLDLQTLTEVFKLAITAFRFFRPQKELAKLDLQTLTEVFKPELMALGFFHLLVGDVELDQQAKALEAQLLATF